MKKARVKILRDNEWQIEEHLVIKKEKVVINLFLRVEDKNNSCIRVTQENLIKSSLQNSLPYILLKIVHANYCAPYPK